MSGSGLYGCVAALTPTLSQRERGQYHSTRRGLVHSSLSRLRERAGVRAQPHAIAPTRSNAP